MRQIKTVFKKELLMHTRNYSLIWIPIVFIVLSIMDPITTYYLPIILEKVGGMPEGATFEMPDVLPVDAFMMSLSQLSMFGVLIAILLTLSTVSGERKSGVLELILVKPVKTINYLGAKWLAKIFVFAIATIIGLLISWYYVDLLFGALSLLYTILAICFFTIWFVFVISVTMVFASLLRSQVLSCGLTVITFIILSIINSIFQHKMPWFYNNLSNLIQEMLYQEQISTDLIINLVLLVGTSILLLAGSVYLFNRKESL
ncbi:ABC transporter permease [Gracilibacillus timonensis]|uniref:ABC transporter permease n=1 Tax=Gracilibacillus timonensis TaxID=1816696 RepID=UPI00082520B2|nr:ABC transporter permease subunit [Gracilibacillus timonensis]